MKEYRLALDIRCETLGWAVCALDGPGPTKGAEAFFDMGVRVFPEGRTNSRNGKTGFSLATERRLARQIRKNRRRVKRRKLLVVHELIRGGLLPAEAELRNRLKNEHPRCMANPEMSGKERAALNRAWDPLFLRFQALERRLEPFELGRVLTHLCARRGYFGAEPDLFSAQTLERKSNLLKIRQLETQLEQSGVRTLGEFLWRKAEKNFRIDDGGGKTRRETIRFRSPANPFFPSRSMYMAEFDLIAARQRPWFPHVRWDVLKKLLFFQRSQKIPARCFCPYYYNRAFPQKSEYRAFRMQPAAYRFKTARLLENCAYIDAKNACLPLSQAQKNRLFYILEHQKSLSFAEATRRLNLSAGGYFTGERAGKFSGNETSCDMRRPELCGELWDKLDEAEQDNIIELLIGDGQEILAAKLEQWPLSAQQKNAVLSYPVKTALAPYSARFMRQISRLLMQDACTFDEAVRRLAIPAAAFFEENSFETLPPYGQLLPHIISINPEQNYGKTWNPTVHAVFNQIRTVVNELIATYGKPAQISFHLAPAVKKTREARDEARRKREFDRKDRERVRRLLDALSGGSGPENAFVLYKLWKELPDTATTPAAGTVGAAAATAEKKVPSKTCVLCGGSITLNDVARKKAAAAFIAPFCRYPDGSGTNLMLAHEACIRAKDSKTIFEAFGSETGVKNPENILKRAASLPARKRQLFTAGVPPYNPYDTGFLAQNMRRYLSAICGSGHIKAYNGGVLPLLPRFRQPLWPQNAADGEKPADYRLGALDALALAGADEDFFAALAALNGHVLSPEQIQQPPSPFDEKILPEKLAALLVSHKPDHSPNGRFFDETAMGVHVYCEQADYGTFRQKDIARLANPALRAQTAANLEQYGWKKTRDLLFSRERTSVILQKTAFAARKNLTGMTELDAGRIVCDKIRADLLGLASQNNAAGLSASLSRCAADTGLRRVRILPKGQEAFFIPSAHNKAYAGADILFADIWRLPQKNGICEHRGIFVSRFEALTHRKEDKKPHPAAKFICRLYKNDTLKISVAGKGACYARVAGFAATQQKIDVRPLSAAVPVPQWNKSIPAPLAETFWQGKKSTQNHLAVNTLFSALPGTVRVAVTPAGTIRHQH